MINTNAARTSKRRAQICLITIAGVLVSWVLAHRAGQAEEASVTVAIASTPALERIRPKKDLARLTLTFLWHDTPLSRGHVTLHLIAPPRPMGVSTGLPGVEGTPLLVLDSECRDGTFTLQYVFPMPGRYTLDLEITPVPEGPAFPPTSLRTMVPIAAHPVVEYSSWLLIGGLFVLGTAAGALLARATAAKRKRLKQSLVVILGLWCGVLPPVSTVSAHPGHSRGAAQAAQGHHVIRGEDGWELEIHTGPEPPHVGALVPLDLWLRKDGVVFAGMTEVTLTATNLDAGQPVVETHVLAREGQTTQHLQLYEGGPHAIAVTVRPAGDTAHGWVPRMVVLNMDALALPAPFTAQLRLMAIGLGVLMLGMGVGFAVSRLVLSPGR